MNDERRHEDGFRAAGRIGQRGGSRGPLAAAVLIAGLLVAAVIKPWNVSTGPGPNDLRPSPSAGSPAPVGLPRVDPASVRSNSALVAATAERSEWGMRSIVESRGGGFFGPPLIEHWAASPMPAAGPAIPGVFDGLRLAGPLSDGAEAVVALGVTTPDDALPLDLRFWRTGDDREWVRLMPQPLPGREPGSWLWRPDPEWSTADGFWPSGTYRVDVLLGARIVRLQAVVMGTLQPELHLAVPARLDAPIGPALVGIPPGPFALTEWGPEAIPLASRGDFDELGAWLAPDLGRGFVAPALGRHVNGLGVVAQPGAAGPRLTIEQLSGVPGPVDIPLAHSTIELDGGRLATFGRPFNGALFADALYRITATWPGGRRQDWEVEVAPGVPPQLPAPPLEALARWQGTLAQPAPIIRVAANPGGPVGAACDPRTRIRSADTLLGVALPPGSRLTGMAAAGVGNDRAPDWRFAFGADGVVPGLALAATPRSGLPPGVYDVLIDLAGPAGSSRLIQRICVGP